MLICRKTYECKHITRNGDENTDLLKALLMFHLHRKR